MDITPPADEVIERFWAEARKVAGLTRLGGVVGENELASLTPPTWAFGATAEVADALVELVLTGAKTATSSALWEWEAENEEPPLPGDLAIVCDGAGTPRALVRTVTAEVVAFDQVPAGHAAAEGEGDLSLSWWRDAHEKYFTTSLAPHDRAFAADMPVLLETFTVLHPRRR